MGLGDLWHCIECGADNPDWYPDECPVCGAEKWRSGGRSGGGSELWRKPFDVAPRTGNEAGKSTSSQDVVAGVPSHEESTTSSETCNNPFVTREKHAPIALPTHSGDANDFERTIDEQPIKPEIKIEPSKPYTHYQPPSSNAAVMRFRRRAEEVKLASGRSRRVSESDLGGIRGAPVVELMEHKPKKHKGIQRRPSFLKDIVPNRTPNNLLKRKGSIPVQQQQASETGSDKSREPVLEKPKRIGSWGRSKPPRVDNNFSSHSGDSGLLKGSSTKPGPWYTDARNVIKRARSRSDTGRSPGLGELMTQHGAPPMPMLAEAQANKPSVQPGLAVEDDNGDLDRSSTDLNMNERFSFSWRRVSDHPRQPQVQPYVETSNPDDVQILSGGVDQTSPIIEQENEAQEHSITFKDLEQNQIRDEHRPDASPRLQVLGLSVNRLLNNDNMTNSRYECGSRQGKPARKLLSTIKTWASWRRDVVEAADTHLRGLARLPTTTILYYLLIDCFTLATDGILIRTGFLEPPLPSAHIRLRWSCKCGDEFFSDIQELVTGGVAELTTHMERSSGVKVSASPYREYTGNQQYVAPRPDRWMRDIIAKLGFSSRASPKPSPCLPRHNQTASTVVGIPPTGRASTQQQPLHLMACMHRDPVRKFVQQDRVEDATTDREVLRFMRQQYIRHRGQLLNMLSLRRVKGIFFVKFVLPMGGSVDVLQHDKCQTICDCLPPLAKVEPPATAEYKCHPVPPTRLPPISPEYLAMLLYCPSEQDQDDTWILDQLPKRTCGRLQGAPGQPAEGWGIYYQEGWDTRLIVLAIFVVFVLASLLFGVLWSVYRFDVQGAFGVSAWIATLGGILIALLIH